MSYISVNRARLLIAALAAIAGIVAAAPVSTVSAASTVTGTILPGPLTAVLTGPGMFTVTDQAAPQALALQITLTVSDLRSTRGGWQVSLAAADLTCTCGAAPLPASSLSIAAIDEPALIAGQSIDLDGGPYARATAEGATLDTARVVVVAHPGRGDGAYTQLLTIQLAAPAHTPAGHYAATWTLTATSLD